MRLIRYLHTARSDFSHAVIGGGIVGTAIAAEFQKDGHNVLLIEKNPHLGMETTSRNSEVVHSGIYYPKHTLKSKLCIEGRNLIYNALDTGKFNSVQVAVQKCGKLVVAQDEQEAEYLHKLHKYVKEELDVKTEFLSHRQLKSRYPHISGVLALNSPTTGIISAHDYLLYHQTQLENHEGTTAFNTTVTDIEYNRGTSNYTVTCSTEDDEAFEFTADVVINSAGLHAQKVSNLLLPPERHYTPYFAKGTYFSYSPVKSLGKFTDTLIYPCPNHNIAALGTHLTFDIGGQIKFGPDLEWLDVNDANEIDYTPSHANLEAAYVAVRRYFPHLQSGELSPSYSGVRPKIASAEETKKGFVDFLIKQEEGYPGFVNLLGIESPGLTSAWAIAKYVKQLL
ncbi:hypothetical protein PSN45_002560 [Yamadazyma tenuis]|uniref:L-2-hydroxyglutarate dehydrogenase, mitochondrial n=1 Tax=Candida tenuis (strain ATCC 10573 / BCRC 21748 / CBS 615 / JCM 9827 / NBRC 10315 / NRRL Y-1498 / VKM Y-70) TaxID=590646 RepID=G3B019_CANTC|nr:FAD dependent oxidoreductase [Yamadazyma tenuis ATCC 10573]XP_006685183.1 uncharacterized protein CANTEDRAFT_113027 [Yamadazyma tenuis ATCC 10573]EGV65496.1 FAD dependent oxidoreductase [Yamadazyma tenuis ATCC 10573]EGV65497.1 hypothetical protein CANTEDRAFT_113027 [Yamadazyma tenuis ATCC 10573]WEJ95051.1 hypothetical protein PSN45_002560 [Yamadazyma tenuis]